ncbi:MAG: carboxypeptidase-like regulatory domain-containing protein [Bacteroidota bacterium]
MKPIQLTIAEPCHQNWNQMLPEEQGKFCLSCQKTVVDFSAMSDREVLNYFNTNTGNTCGRFNDNQLNKTLSVPKERSMGKWKYFWQFLLPAVFAMHKAEAQKTMGKPSFSQPQPIKPEPPIRMGMVAIPQQPVAEKNITVEGKIIDENGSPLAGAAIMVNGTKYGVASDATGNFSIQMKNDQKLTINYIGYESKSLATGDFIKMKGFKMGLKDNGVLMSGFVVPMHADSRSMMGEVVVMTNCFIRPAQKIKAATDSEKSITVNGKIVDEKGNPLAFANIVSADKKNAVATDNDGNFSLKIKNDQSINISYVGYEGKCVAAGDFVKQPGFKMGLKDGGVVMSGMVIPLNMVASTGLADVVVVSYGTISCRMLTGSVTTIKGETLAKDTSKSFFSFLRKKTPAPIETSVKIYPNPIERGQDFQVQIKVAKKDNYLFEIIDASGKIIQSQIIAMNSLQQTVAIDGERLQQAGIYIIHLNNGDKKMVFNGKLVVQ